MTSFELAINSVHQYYIFVRHHGFLKVRNFSCRSSSEGQYASSCEMLCRSVKPLPIYRNFYFFRMSAASILYFFKFQICNEPHGHEGRTASSPCQISLKTLKLRPRYGDISIFQDGCRRQVGFLKLQISNCGTHHKCRFASSCQISWRSVKPLSRYLDLGFFN